MVAAELAQDTGETNHGVVAVIVATMEFGLCLVLAVPCASERVAGAFRAICISAASAVVVARFVTPRCAKNLLLHWTMFSGATSWLLASRVWCYSLASWLLLGLFGHLFMAAFWFSFNQSCKLASSLTAHMLYGLLGGILMFLVEVDEHGFRLLVRNSSEEDFRAQVTTAMLAVLALAIVYQNEAVRDSIVSRMLKPAWRRALNLENRAASNDDIESLCVVPNPDIPLDAALPTQDVYFHSASSSPRCEEQEAALGRSLSLQTAPAEEDTLSSGSVLQLPGAFIMKEPCDSMFPRGNNADEMFCDELVVCTPTEKHAFVASPQPGNVEEAALGSPRDFTLPCSLASKQEQLAGAYLPDQETSEILAGLQCTSVDQSLPEGFQKMEEETTEDARSKGPSSGLRRSDRQRRQRLKQLARRHAEVQRDRCACSSEDEPRRPSYRFTGCVKRALLAHIQGCTAVIHGGRRAAALRIGMQANGIQVASMFSLAERLLPLRPPKHARQPLVFIDASYDVEGIDMKYYLYHSAVLECCWANDMYAFLTEHEDYARGIQESLVAAGWELLLAEALRVDCHVVLVRKLTGLL
eukprot:TRINITY_DN32934_c0_g1_i8.p1 TRINITY_DN32934_c0_g1~~TRINITY_DN32934_c0_g1_i8.p1  ORF type:complete len:583 (-),score=63.85 TRINITY_DN32934_c0_g1_i8:265-2013(-)